MSMSAWQMVGEIAKKAVRVVGLGKGNGHEAPPIYRR
jgi:hypothetical protein